MRSFWDKILTIFFILFILTVNSCQEINQSSQIIASVGNRNIFLDDFINRAELTIRPQYLRLKNIDQKIAGIEIISAEEKAQILNEFNNTAREYPKDKTIQELFIEQLKDRPDYIAVVDTTPGVGTRFIASDSPEQVINVTYKELDEKSSQLAYVLIEKGILAEDAFALRCGTIPLPALNQELLVRKNA